MKRIFLIFILIIPLIGCDKLRGKPGRDGIDGSSGMPGDGTIWTEEGTIPKNHTIKISEIAGETFFINVYVYIGTNYREIPNPITMYSGAYYTISMSTGEIYFVGCPENAPYKIVILLK